MKEEKWKISLIKDGEFNLTLELHPTTDFFLIDITNEDRTDGGGGEVTLATLKHMIKHVGIVGTDYKLWK